MSQIDQAYASVVPNSAKSGTELIGADVQVFMYIGIKASIQNSSLHFDDHLPAESRSSSSISFTRAEDCF